MDTSAAPAAQKLQGDQQNIVVKWRHREGIKRSQRDIPFILYKDPEDDLDELDQSKRCMLFLHIYIKCAVHCMSQDLTALFVYYVKLVMRID